MDPHDVQRGEHELRDLDRRLVQTAIELIAALDKSARRYASLGRVLNGKAIVAALDQHPRAHVAAAVKNFIAGLAEEQLLPPPPAPAAIKAAPNVGHAERAYRVLVHNRIIAGKVRKAGDVITDLRCSPSVLDAMLSTKFIEEMPDAPAGLGADVSAAIQRTAAFVDGLAERLGTTEAAAPAARTTRRIIA